MAVVTTTTAAAAATNFYEHTVIHGKIFKSYFYLDINYMTHGTVDVAAVWSI